MGSKDSSRWFYVYLPMGISGGATSALIPLFAYAPGGSLLNVGIIAAAEGLRKGLTKPPFPWEGGRPWMC